MFKNPFSSSGHSISISYFRYTHFKSNISKQNKKKYKMYIEKIIIISSKLIFIITILIQNTIKGKIIMLNLHSNIHDESSLHSISSTAFLHPKQLTDECSRHMKNLHSTHLVLEGRFFFQSHNEQRPEVIPSAGGSRA